MPDMENLNLIADNRIVDMVCVVRAPQNSRTFFVNEQSYFRKAAQARYGVFDRCDNAQCRVRIAFIEV
jgi:hypothetical protein